MSPVFFASPQRKRLWWGAGAVLLAGSLAWLLLRSDATAADAVAPTAAATGTPAAFVKSQEGTQPDGKLTALAVNGASADNAPLAYGAQTAIFDQGRAIEQKNTLTGFVHDGALVKVDLGTRSSGAGLHLMGRKSPHHVNLVDRHANAALFTVEHQQPRGVGVCARGQAECCAYIHDRYIVAAPAHHAHEL